MSQENVDLVHRWWDAFNADGTAPLALCDEDVVIVNPPSFPIVGPFVGHAGARQWATECWEVFRDLRMEVDDVRVAPDGETVVSAQRATGLMRHTQLPTDVQWAAVWTIRDGKLVRAQGYMTWAEALEAVGVRE